MARFLGVFLLVLGLYGAVMSYPKNRNVQTQQNLANRQGFYGVLTLGAGVVIIAGGIDLSIGSVVGLSAVAFGLLLQAGVPPVVAALAVAAGGLVIGLLHGLLITQLGLQPFLVTLCGLFAYRGIARQLSSLEVSLGGGPYVQAMHEWATGTGAWRGVSGQLVMLLLVAAALAVLLHASVYGRYIYAIGANEQAARYAGIPTTRYKILAYVICSGLAALGGVLELLDVETAKPSDTGSLLELYAITGAVLGGCSLRGGEGNVLGIILGTAVLPLLRQLIRSAGIPDAVEYTIIGTALLAGTILDQLLSRRKE
jgi:ribose transport system permease protein